MAAIAAPVLMIPIIKRFVYGCSPATTAWRPHSSCAVLSECEIYLRRNRFVRNGDAYREVRVKN
jgi:hypothetical protein